ncbi:MAG: GNAT family N-acetyltransferase [Rhodobacteraceae bacterium]|jgi:ribosomal protein S18 acetylase RimI-like enzyme|nr:GNAT family N-acetyltransferase [Paracoccaceae bacterium]
MTPEVRATAAGDVPALCALQARIIRIGGTTAYETPLDEAGFARAYLTRPELICCHAALTGARAAGFQALSRHAALPGDWADIGTFVDPDLQRCGAGQALFAATLAFARDAGLAAINATIRADNRPGLAYYRRIGFRDYGAEPGFAIQSGRIVGRLHCRFDL